MAGCSNIRFIDKSVFSTNFWTWKPWRMFGKNGRNRRYVLFLCALLCEPFCLLFHRPCKWRLWNAAAQPLSYFCFPLVKNLSALLDPQYLCYGLREQVQFQNLLPASNVFDSSLLSDLSSLPHFCCLSILLDWASHQKGLHSVPIKQFPNNHVHFAK